MSFNFGPTLLSWLLQNAPRVHDAIVHADQRSQKRFSGHGSAMAQVYNHMIMPLASTRDRITQIRWGIADFRSRFRPLARRHVAPGNRRRFRIPRPARPARHPLRPSRAAPVRAHPLARRTRAAPVVKATASAKEQKAACGARLDRHSQCLRRHHAALCRSSAKKAAPSPSSSTMGRARAPSPLKAC